MSSKLPKGSGERGWSLSWYDLKKIDIILQEGNTILELGSGASTVELVKKYKVITVESNEKWLNLAPEAKYIYAPIKPVKPTKQFDFCNEWYDPEILKIELKNLNYDLILIDGPPSFRRVGFWKYKDLFNLDVPLVFDDSHRHYIWQMINFLARATDNNTPVITYHCNTAKACSILLPKTYNNFLGKLV